MKLTLLASVDLGISFGVDDTVFEKVRAPALFGRAGTVGRGVPIGVTLPLGTGLEHDLTDTPLAAAWQRAAEAVAAREHPALLPAIARTRWAALHVRVFAIGLATIEITLHVDAPAASAIRVFQAYEYGGYDAPSVLLVPELVAFLHAFAGRAISTSRRRRLEDIAPFDLLPGFQCVLAPGDASDEGAGGDAVDELVTVAQVYERQLPFRRLVLDDGVVHLGWASAVYLPTPQADEPRTYFLLELCQLYYGVCEGFDRMLAARMSESVRGQLGDREATLEPRQLNELRTLAMAVVRLTSLDVVSNNISDLALLDAFDTMAKLAARQARIQSSAEIFFAVQQELGREASAQRERKVGLLVLLLTAVSVVGVVADSWGLVDYDNTVLPDRVWRTGMLLGPALVTVCAAFWYARERR